MVYCIGAGLIKKLDGLYSRRVIFMDGTAYLRLLGPAGAFARYESTVPSARRNGRCIIDSACSKALPSRSGELTAPFPLIRWKNSDKLL
jgi:hypothetical protein